MIPNQWLLCERVVKYIRRTVPRPKRNPKLMDSYDPNTKCLRFGGKCPLGMISSALVAIPVCSSEFNNKKPKWLSLNHINAFIYWWDGLRDPKAAIELVWGSK